MVARKGHRTVLEAHRRLPFPAHWLIVGDGPCREEIQSMTQDLGLSGQVTFLGRISDGDLLALYNACDIFVLTPEEQRWDRWLDSEGFGLVFHEAGACAKPVVGSNVSGCSEAVRHNMSGILLPPGDPVSLAQALARILLTISRAKARREWPAPGAEIRRLVPSCAATPLSLSPDSPLKSEPAPIIVIRNPAAQNRPHDRRGDNNNGVEREGRSAFWRRDGVDEDSLRTRREGGAAAHALHNTPKKHEAQRWSKPAEGGQDSEYNNA
jgi:Glycosyl transferases group 1